MNTSFVRWKVVVAALACMVNGCTSPVGGSAISGETAVASSPQVQSCVKPGPGCPCSPSGAAIDCGAVDRKSGSYVTCSMGTMTCAGGVWGACIGDRIATKLMPSSTSVLHTADFGTVTDCVDDPCDPACMNIVDSPNDLDAGLDSGFEATEAGLSPLPIVKSNGVVCTGLAINPPSLNVTVTGLDPIVTSPSLTNLTAAYVPPDCHTGLANASWSVDAQDLAAISGGVLTLVSAVAGPINATAYSAGFSATAVVNVVTNVVDSSQVSSAVAQQFAATATEPDSIQILYPYPLTVFPRGMAAPIIQWNNNGVAATAAKVTIQYPATGTPTYSVSVILAESNPPQAALSQDGWAYLDQTAAGQDALVSVQRLVNGALLQPVSETIHFATSPLRGNIFYTEYDVVAWTATLKSADPGGTTPAQIAMPNAGCNPCHTVSANGTTLVTSNWGNYDTSVAAVNADGTLTGLANMWNATTGLDSRGFAYSAISPDGLYALQGSNWWGNTLEPTQSEGVSKPHNNGSGLTGAYYAGTSPSGIPVFTENDPTIDFAWGNSSPGAGISGGIGYNIGPSYSVVWTGFVQPIFTETYTFETESSDGVTLAVDGQTIINHWVAQADTKWTGTVALTAGVKVPIVLTYESVSSTAQVHLRWSSAHQPYQIVPVTQLYPAVLAPHGLLGTYYSNINLTGSTEVRVDPTINFNWNGGSPVAGWGGDNWSAEWTGQVLTPCAGTYSFCVVGDDGVRLWIDGSEVDNGWVAQGPTQYCSSSISEVAGALHSVTMDYFQAGGGSVAELTWNSSCAGSGVIPSDDLIPPPPMPPPNNGLLGTYYSNIDFTGTATSEIDPTVNFNWNGGSVVSGSSGVNLSAEWTGQAEVPCTDNYQWCVVGDDGVRLWVDGTLLDDGWVAQGPTQYCSNPISETAGSLHDIKMDYFQAGGGSVAELQWNAGCLGGSAQIIPTANLFPTGDHGLGGYDMPFRAAGDRGTGAPYSIISVPQIVNASPVDVSSASPNAWGLGPTAMMVPAFSPDGTRLVFVDGDTSGGASWRQGLSLFDFNESQMTFTNRRNVVNTVSGNNIIRWPTVESDSRSVIYQTNPVSQDDINAYPEYGGMLPSGYSTIPGQFWSVDALDPVDHPPVSLNTLNAGLGGGDANRSYQPTVLPTSAGGYRWTVFTSDRQYGNIMNVPAPNVTPTTQLWIGALDDATSGTADRSHPPFWLPNQVLGDNGGRIRNERAYWVLDACKPTLATPPSTPPAPPTFTWTDMDIGTAGDPAYAGSASAAGGTFTVVAGGDDIWNNNDAFHYVYMPVVGDFEFQARVTSLAYADYWSKAGVMLRDNLASDSAQIYTMINAGGLTGLQWRTPTGNSSNWTQGPGEAFPYWVNLTRTGTTVVGAISPDGVNWTTVDTQQPAIGSSAYIGLAVTAHNNGTYTTAVFDNVTFGSLVPPDPRPASACQDNQDCCGALTSPPTAACKVDVPVANPVTKHCVALTANSCVAVGGACTSDSDCCGFPSNACTMNVCTVPPPPFSYQDLVFSRDYVASCPAQEEPIWRFFDWETITPGNSDIKFAVGTAATSAGLPTSMGAPGVVPIGTASGAPITVWTGADVGAALTAAGQFPSFAYLRVFMDFQPTSDLSQGPTLTGWRQQFDCMASE